MRAPKGSTRSCRWELQGHSHFILNMHEGTERSECSIPSNFLSRKHWLNDPGLGPLKTALKRHNPLYVGILWVYYTESPMLVPEAQQFSSCDMQTRPEGGEVPTTGSLSAPGLGFDTYSRMPVTLSSKEHNPKEILPGPIRQNEGRLQLLSGHSMLVFYSWYPSGSVTGALTPRVFTKQHTSFC